MRSVIGKVRQTSPVQPASAVPSIPKISDSPDLPSPKIILNTASLTELLQNAFGFSEFSPNQETACQAVTAGGDARLSCRPAQASRSVISCRDWHEAGRLKTRSAGTTSTRVGSHGPGTMPLLFVMKDAGRPVPKVSVWSQPQAKPSTTFTF
jgi:hypothetical protein